MRFVDSVCYLNPETDMRNSRSSFIYSWFGSVIEKNLCNFFPCPSPPKYLVMVFIVSFKNNFFF